MNSESHSFWIRLSLIINSLSGQKVPKSCKLKTDKGASSTLSQILSLFSTLLSTFTSFSAGLNQSSNWFISNIAFNVLYHKTPSTQSFFNHHCLSISL